MKPNVKVNSLSLHVEYYFGREQIVLRINAGGQDSDL